MRQVFISYSVTDRHAAEAICDALEAQGLSCWIAPRDIPPGTEWAVAIMAGITEAALVLLVHSAASSGSHMVRREVNVAVDSRKPIIPVRIDAALPQETMKFYLGSTHWLDACTGPLEAHLPRITAAVSERVGLDPGAQAPPPAKRLVSHWARGDAAAVPLALPDRPSIAVLPFANLSGDLAQEYFSDGVADDIITELSRDRALFVIARNSSFSYRGRSTDVRQVGRELGVRYVMEGTLRRDAGRVRISAQLINASTGEHVWAERYDRAPEDVFAVQDDIANAVATAIRPAVGDAERRRVLRKPPNSLSAWETYQRGLWHMLKVTPLENQQARHLFQQAAEIDPGFASPLVGLALTHTRDALSYGIRPFPEAAALIEIEARKAATIDSSDSEAHAALSLAFILIGEMKAALNCAERAVTLNRNSSFAHWVMSGVLVYSGNPIEGRNEALNSLRLNPRDPVSANAASGLPISYYLSRSYAEAVDAARRCLVDYPDFSPPRRYLIAALGQLGRQEEAKAALEEFMAVAPDVFDVTVRQRPPYVRLEDHEHIIEGLRKAGWQC